MSAENLRNQDTLASRVSGGISDTSTNVLVLRDAVAGSERWKGDAASRWQAVITDRRLQPPVQPGTAGLGQRAPPGRRPPPP